MQLTKYFWKKIKTQMKIIDILPNAPKNRVRLDPIDPQDLCVDLQVVQKWSRNNLQLLHLILQNGMATFICNMDFINNHYQQLFFINKNINLIDSSTLKFGNLRILNLSQNNIKKIQNIPQNLQQLYVDFNQIVQIENKVHLNLVLLSITNNGLSNNLVNQIIDNFKQLRCLNLANNSIEDIRRLVQDIKKLKFIKILNTNKNPISLLKIYYQYITQNIELKMFDNQKYIKPQPPKKQQQPKPQIKQQPKQQKKDPKKDAKKGSKQPQPVKQVPKPEPIIEIKKKQLTQDDYTKCRFNLAITNFQNFTGNLYDPSIFPAGILPQKTQTTYWLQYSFMGTQQQLNDKRIKFQQATQSQNQPNRLSFSFELNKLFQINSNNKSKFQKGILITLHSQQPIIQTTQTGQQKPVKQGDAVVSKRNKIGEVFVDLKQFLSKKDKLLQKQYRLWQPQICSRPYFRNPLPNQTQQINKRKQQFQRKLEKQQQQKMKQLQQEQAAKNQKKGGKDAKKAQKKPQKKQGKQVVSQKKTVQKSSYELQSRLYCYLNEDKIYKARKQTLSVKIWIQ